MIDFQPLTLQNREEYTRCLRYGGERGCEYSFVNLYLWGRQKAAMVHGHLVVFSQFSRRSVYLFHIPRPHVLAHKKHIYYLFDLCL